METKWAAREVVQNIILPWDIISGLEPSQFCYQIMETTYYKQDSERGQRVPNCAWIENIGAAM